MRSAANRPSASSVPTTGSWSARSDSRASTRRWSWRFRRSVSPASSGPTAVLAAGRLEQLHGAERVGRAREQRVEQRGLLAARAMRHAHERAEQQQHQPGRGAREQRPAPGHRERDRHVHDRLDAVARDQREVLERVRGAVGLGRHRIRGAPGRLARGEAPARREQRAQQAQAQIGGDPRHRVADLALREQHQDRLDPERADHDREQRRRDPRGCRAPRARARRAPRSRSRRRPIRSRPRAAAAAWRGRGPRWRPRRAATRAPRAQRAG